MNKEVKQSLLSSNFIHDIKEIIQSARTNAVRSVDFCRVQMYWQMGRRIFEEEQEGKERAEYGTYLIRNLAKEIEPEYGSGFGVRQLETCRQFYCKFPIAHTVYAQLSWSQYKLLTSIEDEDRREYYLHSAVNNCYTFRELERQVNSMLYERLLMSSDKESVPAVARKERIPKRPEEHSTIGILLCTQKNDTVVKVSLPENSNLHAAEYQLYLPSEKLIQQKVAEWSEEFSKQSKREQSNLR